MTKTLTAYHFIELPDSKEIFFKCSECLNLFKIDAKPDPVVETKLRQLREREAKLEEIIRKKKAAAMKAQHEAAVESDLAALKRKMR